MDCILLIEKICFHVQVLFGWLFEWFVMKNTIPLKWFLCKTINVWFQDFIMSYFRNVHLSQNQGFWNTLSAGFIHLVPLCFKPANLNKQWLKNTREWGEECHFNHRETLICSQHKIISILESERVYCHEQDVVWCIHKRSNTQYSAVKCSITVSVHCATQW